jgi:hypothetical protein
MKISDKLGPTGKFPQGKLLAQDEGELTFAVGEQDGNVSIHFGGQVTWLAMTPEQAVALAQVLIAKARQIAKRTGQVLTVQL